MSYASSVNEAFHILYGRLAILPCYEEEKGEEEGAKDPSPIPSHQIHQFADQDYSEQMKNLSVLD